MLASEIHDPAAAAFANTATVVCDQTLAADYPTNVLSLVTLNTGFGHFDNANPFQTVQAFKQKALSLGIRFVENNLFVSLEKQGGFWRIKSARCNIEAPVLVNCAGAWGDQIAAMLGDPVPLEAQALMLIITDRLKPFVKPVVSVQGRSLSFKQFYNGTVLIGGAFRGWAEPEYNRTHLDPRSLAANAANAAVVFPAIRGARIMRCWAGIVGRMADDIPVIGASTAEGAFHAFGFSAHGFALSPIVGRIIADLDTKGTTNLPIDAFSVERFSITASSRLQVAILRFL